MAITMTNAISKAMNAFATTLGKARVSGDVRAHKVRLTS